MSVLTFLARFIMGQSWVLLSLTGAVNLAEFYSLVWPFPSCPSWNHRDLPLSQFLSALPAPPPPKLAHVVVKISCCHCDRILDGTTLRERILILAPGLRGAGGMSCSHFGRLGRRDLGPEPEVSIISRSSPSYTLLLVRSPF